MHPCFYLPVQWSRKSRPLHAKGLEQVLNWLQEIKEHYGCSQDEAGPIANSCFKNSLFYYVQFSKIVISLSAMWKIGSKVPKAGVLLLSSCWKHYAMLLHLEDKKFSQQYKDLLDQYLSAIQVSTQRISVLFMLLLL